MTAAYVPAIQNDLAPDEAGYGEAWQVVNYLDTREIRFRGTFAECEQFIVAEQSGGALRD